MTYFVTELKILNLGHCFIGIFIIFHLDFHSFKNTNLHYTEWACQFLALLLPQLYDVKFLGLCWYRVHRQKEGKAMQ